MNTRKTLGILGATVALLALGTSPMFASAGVGAGAGGAEIAAASGFGAVLTTNDYPDNAGGGHECPDPGACTWVMNQAFNGTGTGAAPRAGTVGKIKVIASNPGHFRLFFALVKPGTDRAKVVKRGPIIYYQGQPDTAGSDVVIETFPVNISVQKGWRIAIKTSNAHTLRCNSGGARAYIYQPGLVLGNGYLAADDTDGCHMLVRAVYK